MHTEFQKRKRFKLYFSAKLNIAFDNHQTIVNMQRLNGLNMGVHHYGRTSAFLMSTHIANEMKRLLVEKIKRRDGKIAIILKVKIP